MSNHLINLNRALWASSLLKSSAKEDPRPFYVGLVVIDPIRQLVMLGQRREDKQWTGPGGAGNPGETTTQAVIRECYEESGLMLQPSDLHDLPSISTHDGKVCHAFYTFVDSTTCHAHNNNDPDRELTAKGWRWYDLNGQPPGNMGPNRLETLNNARMRVLGLTKSLYLALI